MFSDSKNKKNSESSGIPQSSIRGNMDEYEAVRSIVSGNPGLLTRVLEKLRSNRRDKQTPSKTPTPPTEQNKK